MSSARHVARQIAAQALYAFDMGNVKLPKMTDDLLAQSAIAQKYKDFALSLFGGARERLSELDALVSARLNGEWTLDRLGRVERAILRLGCYELLLKETDAPIVINEAVELAKELADNNAPGLINGVLEAIRKEVCGEISGDQGGEKTPVIASVAA